MLSPCSDNNKLGLNLPYFGFKGRSFKKPFLYGGKYVDLDFRLMKMNMKSYPLFLNGSQKNSFEEKRNQLMVTLNLREIYYLPI